LPQWLGLGRLQLRGGFGDLQGLAAAEFRISFRFGCPDSLPVDPDPGGLIDLLTPN
jgi:hypothetical protein